MSKRIKSLLLCFVMVFTMLANAMPVLAVQNSMLTISTDKTNVKPNEEITYTLKMGPVTNMCNLSAFLKLSDGLTLTSGTVPEDLQQTMGTDDPPTFNLKTLKLDTFDAGRLNAGYTSTTDTLLLTFTCTVNADATGDQTVTLQIDTWYEQDDDLTDIQYTITPAIVTVTAAPTPATGISLNKDELTLTAGATETLTATVTPSDTTDTVAWSSNKPEVATVDSTGKVTAVAPGEATITAKAGEQSASCAVTVNEATPTPVPVASIELNKTALTLEVGKNETLTATVKPDNAEDKTVTWTSSDETVATVENGKVTAVKAGTATITAKAGEQSASCAVTVKNSDSGSSGGGGGGSSVTTYAITVKDAKNGDVSANRKSASKGTTITLTVAPDKGYVLDDITVLDSKDKEIKLTEKGGKFTFTMPASKVTVQATFKAEAPVIDHPFTDVPEGSYYEDAVIWAVDKGITGGTSATTFTPDGICTRAQAVTFLWRAAGSPAPKSSAMPFTDVKAGSYYYDAVLWAVEQGITKGTSDTAFSPNASCTRAQIVTFLWRANGSPAVSGNSAFTDVAADAYYAAAVTWAEKNGVTGGIGNGLFGSGNNCTRAQIVTFLYRAMK